MTDELLIEERGPIAILTINRPEKLNAWSHGLTAQLREYLDSLNTGEYTKRCLILTGVGRAFSTGADISYLSDVTEGKQPSWRLPHLDGHTSELLRRCDVPVIGAINGYAVGGGFGLALSTDVRIAADDARFQVTQMKRGVIADGGLGHLLPQAVGDQRALELMCTARWIDAEEAPGLGLVIDVVPRDQLVDAAVELAGQIAQQSRSGWPRRSAWSISAPTRRGSARRISPTSRSIGCSSLRTRRRASERRHRLRAARRVRAQP